MVLMLIGQYCVCQSETTSLKSLVGCHIIAYLIKHNFLGYMYMYVYNIQKRIPF